MGFARYLTDRSSVPVSEPVVDIPPLSTAARERTGDSIQRAPARLERIIKASSNGVDVVLDPFCEDATTYIAAEKRGRRRVGIDLSSKAAELARSRMECNLDFSWDDSNRTDMPKPTDLGKIARYKLSREKQYLDGGPGGYCNGCGRHFRPQGLRVDHIGSLQFFCSACNSLRGTCPQQTELLLLFTDKRWLKRRRERYAIYEKTA